jgi:hypothetical protein
MARYKSDIVLVSNNRFNVLVVEDQNSSEHFQYVFNEASMILNENVLNKVHFHIQQKRKREIN